MSSLLRGRGALAIVVGKRHRRLVHTIRDLVARAAQKTPGSVRHRKLWRHYMHRYCQDVQASISRTVESQVDWNATRTLETNLGAVGANTGVMPDFSNPGALHGYTLNHFGRARLLGDFINQSEPDWLQKRVDELFSSDATTPCQVASLGGGPGYDFVSLSALSDFRQGPMVHATVYEYEPAWRDIVTTIESAVHSISDRAMDQHSCGFAGCDITLPLSAAVNAEIGSRAQSSTNVVVCSYCIAENAVRLSEQDFCFFRHIFAEATDGLLFLFTETTHRLWPDLIDIATKAGLRISTPHISSGKAGWQLALLKDGNENKSITTIDKELYDRFTRDNRAHGTRLDRGWKRQLRKNRGSK